MQTVLNVGEDWTLKSYEVGGRSKVRLNFAMRVTCNENYYGEQCSNYCRPRDDDHGHYWCSKAGHFICRPGWEGNDNYCKTRKYFCVTSSLILRKPVAYGPSTRTSFALATKHDSFSFSSSCGSLLLLFSLFFSLSIVPWKEKAKREKEKEREKQQVNGTPCEPTALACSFS